VPLTPILQSEGGWKLGPSEKRPKNELGVVKPLKEKARKRHITQMLVREKTKFSPKGTVPEWEKGYTPALRPHGKKKPLEEKRNKLTSDKKRRKECAKKKNGQKIWEQQWGHQEGSDYKEKEKT